MSSDSVCGCVRLVLYFLGAREAHAANHRDSVLRPEEIVFPPWLYCSALATQPENDPLILSLRLLPRPSLCVTVFMKPAYKGRGLRI